MATFDDEFDPFSKENKDIEQNASVVYLKGDTTYTESTEDVYNVTEVEQKVGNLNKNTYYVSNETNNVGSVTVNNITNTNANVDAKITLNGRNASNTIILDDERMSYDGMKDYWRTSFKNFLTDSAGTFASMPVNFVGSLGTGFTAGLGDGIADRMTKGWVRRILGEKGFQGVLKFTVNFAIYNKDTSNQNTRPGWEDNWKHYKFSNSVNVSISQDSTGYCNQLERNDPMSGMPVFVRIQRPLTGYFGLYSVLRLANAAKVENEFDPTDYAKKGEAFGITDSKDMDRENVMEIIVTNKDDSSGFGDTFVCQYNFKRIFLHNYSLVPSYNSKYGFTLHEVLELSGWMDKPNIEGLSVVTDNVKRGNPGVGSMGGSGLYQKLEKLN